MRKPGENIAKSTSSRVSLPYLKSNQKITPPTSTRRHFKQISRDADRVRARWASGRSKPFSARLQKSTNKKQTHEYTVRDKTMETTAISTEETLLSFNAKLAASWSHYTPTPPKPPGT